MKQGLGVAVKRTGLCRVVTLRLVIQSQEEGSWLNGIQGRFVYPLAEIFNPSPSPWNSRGTGCQSEIIFHPLFYVFVQRVLCCVCTCFLQSGQLIWVLLAVVRMCHWGSSETVSRVHWVIGGALRCTATLGRNGPCGRQAGASCQSGAARYLQWRVQREKEGCVVRGRRYNKSQR